MIDLHRKRNIQQSWANVFQLACVRFVFLACTTKASFIALRVKAKEKKQVHVKERASERSSTENQAKHARAISGRK